MIATNTQLAQAGNVLVYSAMLVYTAAMLAFVLDLSGRGRRVHRLAEERAGRATEVLEPVAVGALVGAEAAAAEGAGSETAETADAPGAAPADVPLLSDADRAALGRSKAAGIAVSLSWLAFGLHLAGVVARGASVGRAPWGNMYEFAVSGSLVVAGLYLAVLTRRDLRFLGTFVIGPVLLTLGLATTVFYTSASQLVPALQSYWLLIHVTVAFTASAVYTMAFSLTVLQLVQGRREEARAAGTPWRVGAFMDGLPTAARLEHLATRLHIIAFPLWTFTVIAGAIWAEAAWGRYWGWDPKETWSFVIWVVYAAHLHARATSGWSGRAAARIALFGYACIIFNFTIVNVFFKGWHSYSGL